MSVALRFGRNLQSLEFTSDITNRATRIAALCKRLGGVPTFLGNSRWVVTGNASGVLTLADPAGGAPPVAFDGQMNTIAAYYVYRESTAQTYAITNSTASPCTVTITGDPGITVGEYVQFRTSTTAGAPVYEGAPGRTGSLTYGYILPFIVTSITTNTLTLQNDIYVSGVSSSGQFVSDTARFSAHVTTCTGAGISGRAGGLYTITVTSTTGINVGDWCYDATSGQQLSAFPPFEVVQVVDGTTMLCKTRYAGPQVNMGVGSVDLHFVRPVSTSTVTASSVSPNTITVTSASGWSTASGNGALELYFIPVVGEIPVSLDHPVYASSTAPGIGIKFGSIDRQDKFTAVPNYCSNAIFRNWTSGVPDGYDVLPNNSTLTQADCLTQITDPLYTPFGGSSVKVKNGNFFRSKIIPWRVPYPGQRFSFRIKMLISGTWSGDSTAMQFAIRPGYRTNDGKLYLFSWNDPILILVPPDSPANIATWEKPAGGTWFDAVINGFDVTTTKGIGGFAGGSYGESSASTLPNANGFFIAICGNGVAPPEYYVAGISITQSSVAPDAITEFGEANLAHQDVNVALGLLGKPQHEIQVDAYDLYAMNPDAADVIDQLDYPGSVFAHCPELGLVNEYERIIELTKPIATPGRVRITLGTRLAKFIQFFVQSQSAIGGVQQAVNAIQGGSTALPPAPTTTPSGNTTSSGPTMSVTVDLNTSTGATTLAGVPSSTATSVKLAYSTTAMPTAADVRATSAITSLPASVTGPTLTDGQTVYLAGFAYDAQGVESALATTSALYTAFTGNLLTSVSVMFVDSVDLGYTSSNDKYDVYTDFFNYSDSGGRGGGGCWLSRPWGGNGYQMYDFPKTAMGFVMSIDMNSATVPADGHVLLLTQDGTSYVGNVFIGLDSSRHIVAGRIDSASDTTLGTSTFALPASGWGTLEICVGYATTATGYVIVRYRAAGSSTTTIALNLQNVQTVYTGRTANCGIVHLGNPGTDTFTFGETNGGAWDIKVDDIVAYDRTGVATMDYLGFVRVGATHPTTLGNYTNGFGVAAGVSHMSGAMNTGHIRLTAAGDKRSFTCASVSNVASVLSVVPFANFCSTSTSDRLKVGVRSSSTLSESSQFQSSGGVIPYSAFVNPSTGCPFRFVANTDPATSAAWTLTGFANAEVVAEINTLFATTDNAYFTQLGFEFVYRTSSSGEGMGQAAGIATTPGIYGADSFETATNSYGDARYTTHSYKYVAGGGLGSTRCNSVDSTVSTEIKIDNSAAAPYYASRNGYGLNLGLAFWVNVNSVTLTGNFPLVGVKRASNFSSFTDLGEFYLALDTSRNVKAYRVDSGTPVLLGTSSSALPASAWVHLDIRVRGDSNATTSKGTIEVWMTDTGGTRTKILNLANVQTRTTNLSSDARYLRVMTSNGGNGDGMLWKDLVYWNPLQSLQGNGFGCVRVSPLYANAAGTYTGSGGSYTNVVSDDIATYNTLGTAWKDSYNVDNPGSVTIRAACPFWVAGEGGSNAARFFLKSSSAEYAPDAITLPSSIATPWCSLSGSNQIRMIVPFDPSSGSAWTQTTLSAAEVGISDTAGGVKIAQEGIEYVYNYP